MAAAPVAPYVPALPVVAPVAAMTATEVLIRNAEMAIRMRELKRDMEWALCNNRVWL